MAERAKLPVHAIYSSPAERPETAQYSDRIELPVQVLESLYEITGTDRQSWKSAERTFPVLELFRSGTHSK